MTGEQLNMFRDFLERGERTKRAVAGVVRGLQGKDRGAAKVWDATDQEWRTLAFTTVQLLAGAGLPFTAEDVRELVGDPPRPNAMGALFLIAAQKGIIRKVGNVRATRPSLHAAEISEWVGTGAAA